MAKADGKRPRGRPRRVDDAYINSDGYTMVRVPDPNDPDAVGVYVPKQRLVMANHLGRELKKGERVYFNDGNKQNLAIENLRLGFMPQSTVNLSKLECPHCGKIYGAPVE